MDNTYRNGFFTSSQVARLTGFQSRLMTPEELKQHKEEFPKSRKKNISIDGYDSTCHTYIEEVVMERIMGRSIVAEVDTVPMKWGRIMEIVLFNLLGMDYTMTHKQTIIHKDYPLFWSGTPDLTAINKIGEIKCFQPKNFMKLTWCLRLCRKLKSFLPFKEQFKSEYWQCVSNAILYGVKRAEIIGYMPYKSELIEILDQIENSNFLERNGLKENDYYFMREEKIESLAYLPDDSKVSNIINFEFEIPQSEIDFLESRIVGSQEIAIDLEKELIS